MKQTLYIFTLQPLKERYTELWYIWFKRELSKYFNVKYVDGEVFEERITKGAFLPVLGAHWWELKQLEKWIEIISTENVDGSNVLLMDIEYPGLAYKVKDLSIQLGNDVKVYGWLHAGSYTRGDFAERLGYYQRWLEIGWISALDGVFLASKYHKHRLVSERLMDMPGIHNKLYVVGNPFYIRDAWDIAGIKEPKPFEEREYDIIISDRPDMEKNIITTLALAKMSNAKKVVVVTGRKKYEGWNIKSIKLLVDKMGFELHEDLSKSEYYKFLNDSKIWITSSQEENFGYCAVEAMAFNTIPIMPNCCAFREHVNNNDAYLYNSVDEAISKINKYLASGVEDYLVKYAVKYSYVLDKVAKIIMGDGL